MKVKLLKKLRARFIWYYDATASNEWKVYDKLREKEVFGLPDKGDFLIERTILRMMQIIELGHLWYSRGSKFEQKRIKKLNAETKQRFYQKQV